MHHGTNQYAFRFEIQSFLACVLTYLIGASVSEPHTGLFNCDFSWYMIYYLLYVVCKSRWHSFNLNIAHADYTCVQGRRSRSGRPGNHQTNVLTEIASLTLCFQARSSHIVCTDPCPHELHGLDVTESWGDVRTSRFWVWWPHILAWIMIRLNTKKISNWLVCVAPSHRSQGAWNRRWPLISVRADLKWIRILVPCQGKSKD